MSQIKFSPDLFLETTELNRFQSFLSNSTKSLIRQGTDKYGLFYNSLFDPTFNNGQVVPDDKDENNNFCVKVLPLLGYDANNSLLVKEEETRKIIIPNTNFWYWIKVSYQQTVKETGLYSIDTQGNFVCTTGNGKFTERLRGYKNFPTKIKFLNSTINSHEYEVLDVLDDNRAILQSDYFGYETNLTYAIYGTFTPDRYPLPENQYPFRFDDAAIQIVAETNGTNVPPDFVEGYEFYLARVNVRNNLIEIQDKRTQYLHRFKDSDKNTFYESNYSNPINLIGIEGIKWKAVNTTNEENQVKVTWGFLVDTWNVNTTSNQLVLNSGHGGIFTATNDVPEDYFYNWRVYTDNGNYHTITNSFKNGGVITLQLDSLLVDNFFSLSLTTKINQTLVIVPPTNSIEFKFVPDDNEFNQETVYHVTDIKKGEEFIPVPVYASTCFYRVYYRLYSDDLITSWELINSNTLGYLTEDSYTESGILKTLNEQIRFPYFSNASLGFIRLKSQADYYPAFKKRMDININKSETIGFQNNQNYVRLHSGSNGMRQIVSGNTLSSSFDELYISLESDTAVEGSQFYILLRDDLALTNTKLHVVKDYTLNQVPDYIKTIERGDIGVAINSDKGISIWFLYTNGDWLVTELYSKKQSYEMIMFPKPNLLSTYFGTSEGIKKPYLGYLVCNGSNGTPNMLGKFPLGYNPNNSSFGDVGDNGGSFSVPVKTENMPSHKHVAVQVHLENVRDNDGNIGGGGTKVVPAYSGDGTTGTPAIAGGDLLAINDTDSYNTSLTGGALNSKEGEGIPLTVVQPYGVVLYVMRNF